MNIFADVPMLAWASDPTAWLGLVTLVVLEIVLGIDNLIFIAILADKLPPRQREAARLLGLSLALLIRLGLLASISWLVSLTTPLATLSGFAVSGRDLILFGGGLFLLFKATTELHDRLEGSRDRHGRPAMYANFAAVIVQILVLDVVFSLDSIFTAVGMVNELSIMMIAVIVAMVVMMSASRPLMTFVSAHPTVVVLCLGFLLMIGFSLVLEGFHVTVPKGYLYTAIGFSALIEALNQVAQRNQRRYLTRGNLRARTADAVLRLLGSGSNGIPKDEGELTALAGAVAAGGEVLEAAEKDMVRSVLELADRSVQSIMTPRKDVVWLDLKAPPDQLARQIRETGRSRYPLAEGSLQRLVGVGHVKDLFADLGEMGAIDLGRSAAKPLVVQEAMDVQSLLERFRETGEHFAVVVDGNGAVQGVVTPTDVLEAIAGELPQRAEAARAPLH